MRMKFFKAKKGIIICATALLLTILLTRYIIAENTAFYIPPYEKKDISDLVRKKDYNTIFAQTGVVPDIAKEFSENGDIAFLEKMQDFFFEKPPIQKTYIAFPITLEETTKEGIAPLIPLKKGDVLVTFNTRTLDWRHGHCGLVLDDEGSLMLEHIAIGKKSAVNSTVYWGIYPAFMVLRYSDEKIAEAAADYAKDNLVGIPYNLFAGFVKKDKTGESDPSSHCSHIVWQAYKSQGVDIDSDGGTMVTPRDIAKSEKLSVVQILGINPKDFIK